MAAKTVIIANPHGFCAGVNYAVDIVEAALRHYPPPIYVLNEIVHNRHVVSAFEARGVRFVRDIAAVPHGALLIFSAHGVAPTVRAAAVARNLKVVDATCPLVTKVHQEVIRYARDGYSIALIGHRGHEEVIGIAGEAPDHVTVIADRAEAAAFTPRDPQRVAVVTQTTLSLADAEAAITLLRQRFPELRLPKTSDICYATTNRQQAVRQLAGAVELVLVLGATNSSNTRRLLEVAIDTGGRASLISDIADLQTTPLERTSTIGITAGASTPESFIQEVMTTLATHGFTNIRQLATATENISFPLPTNLR